MEASFEAQPEYLSCISSILFSFHWIQQILGACDIQLHSQLSWERPLYFTIYADWWSVDWDLWLNDFGGVFPFFPWIVLKNWEI
jgi:hypothetical protein